MSLACELQKHGHSVSVINVGRDSFFQDELLENGVYTVSLFSEGSRESYSVKSFIHFRSLRPVFTMVQSFRPDIIHSCLYPADLIAGIIGKVLKVPVVWGVFSGHLSFKFYSVSMYLLIRVCGLLSSYLS